MVKWTRVAAHLSWSSGRMQREHTYARRVCDRREDSSHTLMTAQESDPHIVQVMDCTRFSSLQCLLSETATVLKFRKTPSSKIQCTSS